MRRFILTTLFGLAIGVICTPVRAQAPVSGQPYMVPTGYESYGPGTLISYGGYNYVIQEGGTMLLTSSPYETGSISYYTTPSYSAPMFYGAGGWMYGNHYPNVYGHHHPPHGPYHQPPHWDHRYHGGQYHHRPGGLYHPAVRTNGYGIR